MFIFWWVVSFLKEIQFIQYFVLIKFTLNDKIIKSKNENECSAVAFHTNVLSINDNSYETDG